jgi:hypothetical protein
MLNLSLTLVLEYINKNFNLGEAYEEGVQRAIRPFGGDF